MQEENITTLKPGWNLVSMPYKKTIDKNTLTIKYGDEKYTWSEAVENNIILDILNGWDRDNQEYYVLESFEQGHGYWMYANQECVLKK